MTVLQVEHPIKDFDTWKAAFDRDPIDRQGSGVRRYRVFRPLDDPGYIRVDLEFDARDDAEAFLGSLKQLWDSGTPAPALKGKPRARLVEEVASEELAAA